MFPLLLLFLPFVYFFFLLLAFRGWEKIPTPIFSSNGSLPTVSIIIAARNEEKNIEKILNDLFRQRYKAAFEIIVVNDRSSDRTELLINLFKDNHSSFPLQIISPVQGNGKKNAISYGVSVAQNEIILATDADCRMGPNWITELTSPFKNKRIKLVFGPVLIKPEGFFGNFQSFELSTLNGIGAVSLASGMPGMINGANMAYRKDIFEKVNGFSGNEHIPSGDDEFLLAKVFEDSPKGIIYVKSPDALVTTPAEKSLSRFVSQRKRWAAKWNKHHNKWPAIIVFIFNIYFLGLWLGIPFGLASAKLFITSFYLKCIGELLFVYEIRQSLKVKTIWVYFIVSSFLYPFYATLMGIVTNFGTYQWKERKYSVKIKP